MEGPKRGRSTGGSRPAGSPPEGSTLETTASDPGDEASGGATSADRESLFVPGHDRPRTPTSPSPRELTGLWPQSTARTQNRRTPTDTRRVLDVGSECRPSTYRAATTVSEASAVGDAIRASHERPDRPVRGRAHPSVAAPRWRRSSRPNANADPAWRSWGECWVGG